MEINTLRDKVTGLDFSGLSPNDTVTATNAFKQLINLAMMSVVMNPKVDSSAILDSISTAQTAAKLAGKTQVTP